ncbi:FxsA family protein [Aldersonia sp. NBC_00410]|uniref:FxsA family protein n=1 Tax=Aldersonia sp. NBC_00410 TaxID=2975954 RepID=UPI00225175E0|nr:FxsA family protein [Aldersonia sp. NBC_00410]MCX5045797.1 FxsA family protein [Aldersonia sp. NBC_00410]
MPALFFVAYVLVELAAFVWAVNTIGVVWTILLLLAGTLVGIVLVRSQWRTVRDGFQRVSRGERSAGGAVADGALVGLGAVLMFVPGLVTSVLGLLLLLPPTRMLLRPLVVVAATKRFGPLTVVASGYRRGGGAEVIDGEVVDGTYTDPVTQRRLDPPAAGPV